MGKEAKEADPQQAEQSLQQTDLQCERNCGTRNFRHQKTQNCTGKIRLRIEDSQDQVMLIAVELHNLRRSYRNLS